MKLWWACSACVWQQWYRPQPNWSDCEKMFDFRASFEKKKHICTLIIARVTGQVAWPYLQIITVWIRDGGGDIYICMTSRMQMHFSASTIRGCSPFTAHGLRTVWHSNLLTLEVWCAVYAAQASGSESTCLICCRSFRAWDWFVCETIKATGSNGEGKLVPLGGPIYLSTQRTDRNSRCFCQLLEPKIEARVNPE